MCSAAVGILGGCAEPLTDHLRPVDGATADRTPNSSRSHTSATSTTTTTTTTTAPAPDRPTQPASPEASTAGGGRTDAEARAIVDDVLVHYDRGLTAMLRDPGVIMRPDDPAFTAWRERIGPGAILADDIRNLVAERLAAGQIVEPPRGQDRSYLHRVVSIDDSDSRAPEPTERISFSWCGWSPGIVRDAKTGAVVDDGVGHATGTGTVRRFGTTWLLDSLDESTIDVLAAGSPDPCPRGAR